MLPVPRGLLCRQIGTVRLLVVGLQQHVQGAIPAVLVLGMSDLLIIAAPCEDAEADDG